MSERRQAFMAAYLIGSLLLVGFSWDYSARQASHDRDSEKIQNDMRTQISGMATDLHITAALNTQDTLSEIERRVLPRKIHPDEAAAALPVLKQMGNRKFQITVTDERRETIDYAQSLAGLLIQAGWMPGDSGPLRGCSGSLPSGVAISGRFLRTEPKAAASLSLAISYLNVTQNDDVNMNSCAPQDAIEIFVGAQ